MENKDWKWIKSVNSQEELILPLSKDEFVISVDTSANKFNATTDCNRFFGDFQINSKSIIFNNIGSTRMRCLGSQERVFIDQLAAAKSYKLDESQQFITLITEDGTKIFLEAI